MSHDRFTTSSVLKSGNARTSIHKLSQLLNTGLAPQTLDICVRLLEAGVHPLTLAQVIQEIRSEMDNIDKEE
jgi:hypothetical protein